MAANPANLPGHLAEWYQTEQGLPSMPMSTPNDTQGLQGLQSPPNAGPRPNVPASSYGSNNWGQSGGELNIPTPTGEGVIDAPQFDWQGVLDEIGSAFQAGDWDALGAISEQYPELADSFIRAEGGATQDELDRQEYLKGITSGYGSFADQDEWIDFLRHKYKGQFDNPQGKGTWFGGTGQQSISDWEQDRYNGTGVGTAGSAPNAMDKHNAGLYQQFFGDLLEQQMKYPTDFNAWKSGLTVDPLNANDDINTFRFINGKVYMPGEEYTPEEVVNE